MTEEWPLYDAGPREHVHALGVVSVNYNNLEWILMMLHEHYSGSPPTVIRAMFLKSDTAFRLSLLNIADARIKDHATKGNVLHFIKGYEACSFNRNILIHSQLLGRRERRETMPVMKWSKSGSVQSFDFRIDEIRRVADEIFVWYIFGNRTFAYAIGELAPIFRKTVATLPEKPPLPTKLEAKSPPTP